MKKPNNRYSTGPILSLMACIFCTACTTAPSWDTDNTSIQPLITSSAKALLLLDPQVSLYILEDPDQPPVYYVGSGDELLITFWGSPNLWSETNVHGSSPSKRATVIQPDGTISLPLLNDVKVRGMTLATIKDNLVNRYRRVIDTPFQLAVQLGQAGAMPVSLEGAFVNPGVIHIAPGRQTLGDIISASGGFADDADTVHGILTRSGTRYAINYRNSQKGGNRLRDLVMKPDDILFFPTQSERVYYVFGEVLRQSAYPIPPRGVSLLEGIARAWGPNMVTGNMETIFLIRAYSNERDPIIFELSMEQIMAHEDVALLPGDRIFIPPTGLASWSRTLNQLFGGTASATQTLQTFNIE